MEAMCHTPRERKSKFLDKSCSVERERERQKRKERKGKKGQNVGMFGTVFGQSGTEFQTVTELCVLFLCVIAGKMNNMLVV